MCGSCLIVTEVRSSAFWLLMLFTKWADFYLEPERGNIAFWMLSQLRDNRLDVQTMCFPRLASAHCHIHPHTFTGSRSFFTFPLFSCSFSLTCLIAFTVNWQSQPICVCLSEGRRNIWVEMRMQITGNHHAEQHKFEIHSASDPKNR